MGILLCEQNFRDVWIRNKSVREEIGQILRTHTHAAKLVVEIIRTYCTVCNYLKKKIEFINRANKPTAAKWVLWCDKYSAGL